MKEKIIKRLSAIEEALRGENVIPMVCVRVGNGPFQWNGNSYPTENSLDDAVRETCGEWRSKPLVIVNIHPIAG